MTWRHQTELAQFFAQNKNKPLSSFCVFFLFFFFFFFFGRQASASKNLTEREREQGIPVLWSAFSQNGGEKSHAHIHAALSLAEVRSARVRVERWAANREQFLNQTHKPHKNRNTTRNGQRDTNGRKHWSELFFFLFFVLFIYLFFCQVRDLSWILCGCQFVQRQGDKTALCVNLRCKTPWVSPDFVHSGQRVHDDHLALGARHEVRRHDVLPARLLVFALAAEALPLDASHVQNVCVRQCFLQSREIHLKSWSKSCS